MLVIERIDDRRGAVNAEEAINAETELKGENPYSCTMQRMNRFFNSTFHYLSTALNTELYNCFSDLQDL